MTQGAYTVHKEIKQELENYIKTQYFGKTPVLFNALKEELSKEGVLYREPYIESTPAYSHVQDIATANIDSWCKDFLHTLAEANLGVFHQPYVHQIEALEHAVKGENIFVSTGTGSGKTECFMWPLITKLLREARLSESWNQRGIRSIIMYPMNALVSDQLSRLRNIIGDPQGIFCDIFRQYSNSLVRRPQFGMYTGRTPYPGEKQNIMRDKKLAATYSRLIMPEDGSSQLDYYNVLLKQGRIPAKKNLNNFVKYLSEGVHMTDPEDAELLTRFEMQKYCPDILITNYSMLEYMLFRSQEQSFWRSTRSWLDSNPDNKLLFVIDEAHMYRGSAGGEVALLLRRLFHKLKISKERVQFILTTASMPNENKEDLRAVKTFFCDLTGQSDFVYISGERKKLSSDSRKKLKYYKPSVNEIESIENPETSLDAINNFWRSSSAHEEVFDTITACKHWMYEHALDYLEFKKLLECCQGKATPLSSLSSIIYPEIDNQEAQLAVSRLISIAQLACSDNGQVLFPAKMHLLFRGLRGVNACTNPNCPQSHTGQGIELGALSLSEKYEKCPECNSVVYELYQDRRCGALFFHGFVSRDEYSRGQAYLWRFPGKKLDKTLLEIFLYIPEKGFVPDRKRKSKYSVKPCYLNIRNGIINFYDDSKINDQDYRKLYYCDYAPKDNPNEMTFTTCPHCRKALSKTKLSSFATRGNQSFDNLIRAQFNAEDPIHERLEDRTKYPNAGRKVLLFSDSRQRAATLARDMSKEAEIGASRQLFMCAIRDIQQQEQLGVECSMDLLYGYFIDEVNKHHIMMFGEKFKDNCSKLLGRQSRTFKHRNRGRRSHRTSGNNLIHEFNTSNADNEFWEMLLRMYCGNYNTFIDDALSWVEPTNTAFDNVFDSIIDDLEVDESRYDELEKKIIEVFNAWFMQVCDTNQAIGSMIPNYIRSRVRRNYKERYGLSVDWDFSQEIIDAYGWENNKKEHDAFHDAFQMIFLDKSNQGDEKYFIQFSKVVPRFNNNHDWYRCTTCSEVTPFLLNNTCPCCGSRSVRKMSEQDFDALIYWRKSIFDALDGGSISIIDTEEHTAQLSHDDKQDKMWSKTEEYELRFQDMIKENECPVDILSCTTTMEVGVDIGSLVAIGLRNIPPMRENYQQRAGRAGRRGSALSTVLTYCENGVYDSIYFQDPTEMFSGTPRRPWIDVTNEKLLHRHFNMIALHDFLHEKWTSDIDGIKATEFFDQDYKDKLSKYLSTYCLHDMDVLFGKQGTSRWLEKNKNILVEEMDELGRKVQAHRELFEDLEKKRSTSLLDALYNEAIIPTYSFPKNVVSMYISDNSQKYPTIKYQLERGLDIAISEFAPGRSVVVDKTTYQVGGLYCPGAERTNNNSPASRFAEDPNYRKDIVYCADCTWFGLADSSINVCPFCGSKNVKRDYPMIKPWGFAPVNGKASAEIQIDDQFSWAGRPLYSTLSEGKSMKCISDCENIRMELRADQSIIMKNDGPQGKRFEFCPDCGAIVPVTKGSIKSINKPFRGGVCSHPNAEIISLGFEFVTDMLVLEFKLDHRYVNCRIKNNMWAERAAASLAECIKLIGGRRLDIESNELVSGFRIRKDGRDLCIDIYIYDDLSSGAGYSTRIADDIESILDESYQYLAHCDCDAACYNCLLNYGNRHDHELMNRHAALDLLRWGQDGVLPEAYSVRQQYSLLSPILPLLHDVGIGVKKKESGVYVCKNSKEEKVQVCPEMIRNTGSNAQDLIIGDYMLKYALPTAMEYIMEKFH